MKNCYHHFAPVIARNCWHSTVHSGGSEAVETEGISDYGTDITDARSGDL